MSCVCLVAQIMSRGCSVLRLSRSTLVCPVFSCPLTGNHTFTPGQLSKLQYLDLRQASTQLKTSVTSPFCARFILFWSALQSRGTHLLGPEWEFWAANHIFCRLRNGISPSFVGTRTPFKYWAVPRYRYWLGTVYHCFGSGSVFDGCLDPDLYLGRDPNLGF